VSTPTAGLLDTSVFIAREVERTLGQLPTQVTVSVVTIGELQLGVLSAQDGALRARRGDTLSLAKAIDPMPISESIMGEWARLVLACRKAGITRMVKLTDALIAATAIDLGLPVVTQDDDFDRIALAHPVLDVLKV
jgi:predicted nucleic acid-binding protein